MLCSVTFAGQDDSGKGVEGLSKTLSGTACCHPQQGSRVVLRECCYRHLLRLNLMLTMQASCSSSSATGTPHRRAQRCLRHLEDRSGLNGTDLVLATQALAAQVCHSDADRSACAGRESWR